MNNKSKGQKVFLLVIISVVCIFAFCMAGCNLSCFGCDLACDYEDETLKTGVNNSCTSCGSTNSCGTGCGGYFGDEGISTRIVFLTDSVKDNGSGSVGGLSYKKYDSCANYAMGSCFIDDEINPGCGVTCGSYDSDDGATDSYISCNKEGFDTGCAEESRYGVYSYLKMLIEDIFG